MTKFLKKSEAFLALQVENDIGITAGLMDRVIQVYGGCVHMNFRNVEKSEGNGNWRIRVRRRGENSETVCFGAKIRPILERFTNRFVKDGSVATLKSFKACKMPLIVLEKDYKSFK